MKQPSDLQQLREIFEAVVDLPDGSRAARLDELCGGDAALRSEVEALLGARERAGAFLSEPEIRPQDALAAPLGLEEGSIIGKYRLLEQIGEGANAVVYMVEQVETLRRRAALKVIKLGMDTREVIARFETERQALAIMDHPNIAKVLDAGATDSGRPYFVMELVKGIPITDYCDRNKLAVRERLELFIVVCQALQHAHLKGLIHRDVKPSNVLVTLHDGAPVPKVIDFGIAKATESRLTDRTLFTRFHQFIGTPAYMSPEQAEMSGLDVDTRSDIYSLGVLLYELLTGSTPFDGKQLLESGYPEIQRVIRERDPDTPSTRLATLSAEGLTAVSKSRSIQPGELGGGIRGDLDWIVMKALEKDRTRRYETAGDFIRDVRRHLDNEPVDAGPPSRIYRMNKFFLRHRPAVVAASLVSISLVAALLIASFGLVRARRDAAAARRQAERADAVTQLLDEMFQSATPGAAKGKDFTVRELLDDFSARVAGQLASEPEVEMTVRRTVGIAYEGLGEYVRAESHLRRARELARQVHGEGSAQALEADARLGWLIHELDNPQAAATMLDRAARAQLQLLGADHPDYLQTIGFLAASRLAAGDPGSAELLAKQVMAAASQPGSPDLPWVTHILTQIYRSQGKDAEADELSADLLGLIEGAQGELVPRTFEALHTAVQGQIESGDLTAAEESIRRGLQTARRTLGDDHRTTLLLLGDLGSVAQARGEPGDAIKLYSGVLEEQRRTLGDQDPDTIQTLLALAGLRLERDENQLAETIAQEAFETASRRFGDGDAITIGSVCELAEATMRQGRYKEAETILRRSYQLARDSLGEGHKTTVNCARKLGRLYAAQQNWNEAERYSRAVLGQCRANPAEDAGETCDAIEDLAEVLERRYRYKEAQDLAAELLERRGSIQDRRRLANLYRKRTIPGPAVELLEQALAEAVEAHGADDKITLEIMRDQVEAYSNFYDDARAVTIATEGLKLANSSLGRQHPLTQRLEGARNTILKVMEARRRSEASARGAYEDALAQGTGIEKAWNQWILALTMTQDTAASTGQVEKFLETARRTHGDDHPSTLRARYLAAWHAKRCFDNALADRSYRELIEDQQRLLDPLDYQVRLALNSYTDFLLKRDRHEEADAILDAWQDRLTGTQWSNTETLVPRRSRWNFLNHERDEGSAWKEFGDGTVPSSAGSTWQTGIAPFGYGITGAGTAPWQVAGRYSETTLYFRRGFDVPDPAKYSALKIRLRREGGAAVYLNGEEIVRDKLVPGAAFNTSSEDTEDLARYAAYVFIIDPASLREGENIIAVEIHQEQPGSPDMAFDLELAGQLKEGAIE